jgi:hypothetical protein
MKAEVNDILMKILFDEFIPVFDECKCRMHECIDMGCKNL